MNTKRCMDNNCFSEKRKVDLLCKIIFLEFYDHKAPFSYYSHLEKENKKSIKI